MPATNWHILVWWICKSVKSDNCYCCYNPLHDISMYLVQFTWERFKHFQIFIYIIIKEKNLWFLIKKNFVCYFPFKSKNAFIRRHMARTRVTIVGKSSPWVRSHSSGALFDFSYWDFIRFSRIFLIIMSFLRTHFLGSFSSDIFDCTN